MHRALAKRLECSPMARETWVQSEVQSYQRLKKWYLMPICLTLSIIRYGSRVKWNNPEKGVALSPTSWYSKLSKKEPSGHPWLRSPTLLTYEVHRHSVSVIENYLLAPTIVIQKVLTFSQRIWCNKPVFPIIFNVVNLNISTFSPNDKLKSPKNASSLSFKNFSAIYITSSSFLKWVNIRQNYAEMKITLTSHYIRYINQNHKEIYWYID